MNDNADTIETAELDKVVADVLNYDNMMNVDMYIDLRMIYFLGEI